MLEEIELRALSFWAMAEVMKVGNSLFLLRE